MENQTNLDWVNVSLVGTAVAVGLMAGVFFAFSAFVMSGIDRLPDADSVAAMQSINVTAVSPLFMTVLFGACIVCCGGVVWAALNWSDPRAPWVLAGCLVYVIGTIFVTIGGNVPLNDTLESVNPASAGAADDWSHFLNSWTIWNDVRTVSSIAAAALLTIAALQG